MNKMVKRCALVLCLLPLPALAVDVIVHFEIPRIDAAEYHRPYVAVWVEDARRRQVIHLAHWLEQEKWHRDLRSWWRRGGKSLRLPVDGVTGATRRPGTYTVDAAGDLADGDYTLNVEAVREVGGREHIRIPFTWHGATLQGEAVGEHELGAVSYTIKESK